MIFNDIAIKSNTETKEKLYMKTTLFFDLFDTLLTLPIDESRGFFLADTSG